MTTAGWDASACTKPRTACRREAPESPERSVVAAAWQTDPARKLLARPGIEPPMAQLPFFAALVAVCVAAPGCSRPQNADAEVESTAPPDVSSLASDLLRRVAAGKPQGPLRVASVEEAAIMLTFSTLPGDECVAYLTADALYKAGYTTSSWPMR